MRTFLKSALWDFLLCVAASASFAYTLCSGFYSTQPYQQSVTGVLAIIGIGAAVSAALFAVTLNRRVKLIGVPLLVLAGVGAIAAAFATSSGASVFDDVPGNNVFFALCMILAPLCVFFLSRWRPTAVLLIVIGVLVGAAIEYLYWYGHVVAFVVFLMSSAALYMYRTYQRSLLNSESERLSFASVTLAGLGLAALATLAAFGVFAAVIAPLNPPNMVLKLITEHYRVEEIEVRGIANVAETTDPNLLSNVMGQIVVASSLVDEDLEDSQNDNNTDQGEEEQEQLGLADDGVQDTPEGSGLASLGLNERVWLAVIVACSILLLVLAAIAIKKSLRARRYRTMTAGDRGESVVALYLFFLDRFRRLKMPQPDTHTLGEYVVSAADVLAKFESGAEGPAFAQITDVYIRQEFGSEPVTDEEWELFEGYYHTFYKRACRFTGRVRYCFKFFVL